MSNTQQVITIANDIKAGDNIVNVGIVSRVVNYDYSVQVFIDKNHSESVFVLSYAKRKVVVVERKKN